MHEVLGIVGALIALGVGHLGGLPLLAALPGGLAGLACAELLSLCPRIQQLEADRGDAQAATASSSCSSAWP
jgi:hypothetical protein